MTDLPGLLEKVKKCEGPDTRVILIDAYNFLLSGRDNFADRQLFLALLDAGAFTDAALGLVERVLPGCAYRVQRNLDGSHWAELQRLNQNPINAERYDVWNEGGNQKTAPLAILAALLSALIANPDLARVK